VLHLRRIVISLVAAVATLVALVAIAPASAALPKLVGTVGPAFTITLKKNGVRVTKVKPGRYIFVIRDRADIHNFHLRGPGVNRALTSVPFVGTKTFTTRLRAGKYRYLCDAHPFDMRGSFRVG
jgi:plastocyanin